MELPFAKGLTGSRRDGDRLRAVMIGVGGVAGGLGLAWATRRLLPRLYLAPGWPGSRPHWSPADKVGVGTAIGPDSLSTSLVWFSLGHGAISEVFYPRTDRPCVRDLSLVVTDGRRFISDERCDAEHRVEYLAEGASAYRLINTCLQGRYRIEKTVIAHPRRNAVLQHTRFTPLRGSLEDYFLFATLDPHLGLRKGLGGTGWVDRREGRSMLMVDRGNCALALACSTEWAGGSVGYVGSISDGRRDVMRHGRMTRHYRYAPRGNVLLTGEADLRRSGGEFILALGLCAEPGEAAGHALAGIRDDFDALVAEYVRDWQTWQETLLPLDEVRPGERGLYRTSAMVLRVHEDKTTPGAIAASLSIPWGQAMTDKQMGEAGYHMVWPRDLCQIAGGLLAAGARDEARRVLGFLRDSQQEDGHWAQNMWADGKPFWSGIQLGETAMPILLADLLHREKALDDAEFAAYRPMILKAARYVLRRGPSTQEDRWEDERGYTACTLGSLIAALLVASEMADRHGEAREATFLRETADAWYSSIDYWTYVENSKLARRLGVPGYYLRIAPPDDQGEPAQHDHLEFWYQGPAIRKKYPPAAIVSPDALSYVRFGLRAPDDPRIVATMKVIDAITKVETPEGPSWHRYNHDGYGEKTDGSPFDGKHSHGRAWPLLTAERAHVELAAGRLDEAVGLLRAVERFAGDGGLIPEQVWDTYDIPEHDLYFGRPSGSAMPLAWAHAEYVKLLRGLRDGRVFDLPPQTVQRYLVERVESPRVIWRMDHRRRAIPLSKILRIELPAPAVIHWSSGGSNVGWETPTRDSGLGIHYADLATERLDPGDWLRFRIAWTGSEWLTRKAGEAVLQSVVCIEEADHLHQESDGRRHPASAGTELREAVGIP
jgi:glucoamylase